MRKLLLYLIKLFKSSEDLTLRDLNYSTFSTNSSILVFDSSTNTSIKSRLFVISSSVISFRSSLWSKCKIKQVEQQKNLQFEQ